MKGYKKYIKNDALTSQPAKITVKFYEKIIFNLNIVKEKYPQMKYKEADERLLNTEQILNELIMGINTQMDELSKEIYELYEWCVREVKLLRVTKEVKRADDIISVIQDLLDAYKGVIKKDGN